MDGLLGREYLAGMSLNHQGAEFICDDMLLHRKFPENLLKASPDKRQALKAALGI